MMKVFQGMFIPVLIFTACRGQTKPEQASLSRAVSIGELQTFHSKILDEDREIRISPLWISAGRKW